MSLDAIQRLNDQYDSYEPLSMEVRKKLGIRSNAQLPLMIHCAGLTLPGLLPKLSNENQRKTMATTTEEGGEESSKELVKQNDYEKKQRRRDLVIAADQLHHLPPHFVYTLNRLELNIFDRSSETPEMVKAFH